MKENTTRQINTKSIIYIALFVTLIYVSSLIKISVLAIPFTLQTLAVMLTGCFLGAKRGLYAVSIYILMGLIGIPVFTKGGGFFYVLEHTFGYILAFIPAVLIIGHFKKKVENKFILLVSLLFLTGVIMLLIGAVYAFVLLSLTSGVNNVSALVSGYFLAFIPAEFLKAVACAVIYNRLKKHIGNI